LAIFAAEGFAMAGTNKLDVGKALEKLRGAETPKSRITRLDEKIGELDKERERLKALNRRLDRGQQRAKRD
jgi:hypothetical protein